MLNSRASEVLHEYTPAIIILVVAGTLRSAVAVLQVNGVTIWPSWIPGPNQWGDFRNYIADLELMAQGYIPYRDFAFNYGPFFLYAMFPFYAISSSLAAFPALIADTFTSVLVYLSAKSLTSGRLALGAGLAYAISPFVVFNEGYLWLSGQPMTLFMVGTFYLMRRNRPMGAMLCLAVGALFKQEALFILPPMVLAYWNRRGWGAIKGVFAGSVTFILGLAPFLVLAPRSLIYSLMYGSFVNLGPVEPSRLPPALSSLAPTLVSSPVDCPIVTIPSAYTGTFCGSIVNTQQFVGSLGVGWIEHLGLVLEPMILTLFAVALIAAWRSPAFLGLASAYSVLACLFIFSQLVHGLLAYYTLPVYAILAASSTDKWTTTATVISLMTASFVPEGSFAFLLPLAAVFAFTAFESRSYSLSISKKTLFS